MDSGIAYIISNSSEDKHKRDFIRLCNRSIYHARCLRLPIAVLTLDPEIKTKADYHIDGTEYFKKHKKSPTGLVAAELLKTYICDWSPFDKTLYLDCDAFVIKRQAIDYLEVLDCGYELSLTTCLTMAWKDNIEKSPVRSHIFDDGIPQCFPYWNFGVFGVSKRGANLMKRIRDNFLKYAFKGSFMKSGGATPHAQPAVVNAAYQLSPDHKIFTMPAKYNCHFAVHGGYVFNEQPVILHMWKDLRNMMLEED